MLAEQVEPYVAHRPKETLLYRLVEKNYPQLKAELKQQGKPLPRYVEQEFEAYQKQIGARIQVRSAINLY